MPKWQRATPATLLVAIGGSGLMSDGLVMVVLSVLSYDDFLVVTYVDARLWLAHDAVSVQIVERLCLLTVVGCGQADGSSYPRVYAYFP